MGCWIMQDILSDFDGGGGGFKNGGLQKCIGELTLQTLILQTFFALN